MTARLAKGGTVLEPKLSAGTVDTPRYGEVDGVNAVAVRCADGSLAVFAVNRSLEATAEFEIRLRRRAAGIRRGADAARRRSVRREYALRPEPCDPARQRVGHVRCRVRRGPRLPAAGELDRPAHQVTRWAAPVRSGEGRIARPLLPRAGRKGPDRPGKTRYAGIRRAFRLNRAEHARWCDERGAVAKRVTITDVARETGVSVERCGMS